MADARARFPLPSPRCDPRGVAVDCKPGSVLSRASRGRAGTIPLGDALPRRSSTLTRMPSPLPRLRRRGLRAGRSRRHPYSSLLREGLASPPVTRPSRVGSYPTISPLPVRSPRGARHRRCHFCCAFPRVTPGRRYRPPCPAEPGLSSRGRCLPAGDPSSTSRAERSPGHRPAASGEPSVSIEYLSGIC